MKTHSSMKRKRKLKHNGLSRLSVLLHCLIVVCVFGPATALAEFRVMTLNAEWLWTPFDNKVDGSIASIRDMSIPAYSEELAFYAALINTHKIDILAISEIENEQVARELAGKLGKQWTHYFKQGLDTATGQDVAILSRLPYVEGSLTHFNFPAAKLRLLDKPKKITKLVGAQFWLETNGKREKLGVITAHFLSKRNENKQKSENRQKQALALRQAIDVFAKDTDKILVLGDFNDQIDSATLTILQKFPLQSYASCENFLNSTAVNDLKSTVASSLKKWRRNIDHILFTGLHCLSQEKTDLQSHSDHDAIFGRFNLPR